MMCEQNSNINRNGKSTKKWKEILESLELKSTIAEMKDSLEGSKESVNLKQNNWNYWVWGTERERIGKK